MHHGGTCPARGWPGDLAGDHADIETTKTKQACTSMVGLIVVLKY